MNFGFSDFTLRSPIVPSAEGRVKEFVKDIDKGLQATAEVLAYAADQGDIAAKNAGRVLAKTAIVEQLADKTNVARLEKGVLGCIKGVMTLSYLGVVYVPAQLVCGILGLGIAISGLRSVSPEESSKVKEGINFAAAPTQWLINLAKLSFEDIKEAVDVKKPMAGPVSIKASFGVLEAELSKAFKVDESAKETKNLQNIAAGVCKVGTAVSLLGFYKITQIISGVIGISVGGSSYLRGKNVQPGINIGVAPSLGLVALFKSAYTNFSAVVEEGRLHSFRKHQKIGGVDF